MTTNSDAIQTNSQQPKSATINGDSATQHSIPDQIAADRYAETQAAKANRRPGIRLFQLRNRGTV